MKTRDKIGVLLLVSLSVQTLFGLGCDERTTDGVEDRVEIRVGNETAAVTLSNEARSETPIEMAAAGTQNIVTTGLGLKLLATVASPEYEGTILQADDVLWKNDYVFASYNVAGDQFLGAIQIVDVSNMDAPQVVAEAIYPDTDINRIIASGQYVLAAGADFFDGATLELFQIKKKQLKFKEHQAIGSCAGTYVTLDGNRALVTFGDVDGGVAVFDISKRQPSLVSTITSFDARWVSGYGKDELLLVAGNPFRLAHYGAYSENHASLWGEAAMDGGSVGAPTWGVKRQDTLYINGDEAGLLIYDIPTLSKLGALSTSGTANGVAVTNDGRLAFLANGEAGLVVADVGNPLNPTMLASLDVVGDSGSANAVSVNGEYLALADGLGGVKLLHYDRVITAAKDDCDGDGTVDDEDPDDDNDGVLDEEDAARCNPDIVCEEGTVHYTGGFIGDFYNLPCDHPDMETRITGVVKGTRPADYDWFDDKYYAFTLERESLVIEYGENYFPVDEGLCGDPYYFAVHWYTTAVVSEEGFYSFELGSDDDGWLYIDGELIIDNGGIHGIERQQRDVFLTRGAHRIDIYFAERHKVQSGLEFEMVLPPSETARFEFIQHLCLDKRDDTDHDGESNEEDVAPLDND